jgi:hypothetical protein
MRIARIYPAGKIPRYPPPGFHPPVHISQLPARRRFT